MDQSRRDRGNSDRARERERARERAERVQEKMKESISKTADPTIRDSERCPSGPEHLLEPSGPENYIDGADVTVFRAQRAEFLRQLLTNSIFM